MREFKTVFMRGGTSKGLMFLKENLPADRAEWDHIFLQCMGCPDPKQIDGMGGTVSSNNKIVIVEKSKRPGVDVEYLVGQVVVGTTMVDYKSNCGNMTGAVAPFAIEEGLVNHLEEPATVVKMYNLNTDKYINVEVPVKDGGFNNVGDCAIAGIDGTAGELKVNFLNPAGAKTGKLLPTGNPVDVLHIDGLGDIEATILDISNPMVLVRAEDIGATGLEMPETVNGNKELCDTLEKIRGTAACMMGFAKDLADASAHSPAVPKVGFFTAPVSFTDIAGKPVSATDMDVCARVISVFKCHKACPLTSASAIAVASFLKGTIVEKTLGAAKPGHQSVRIGHPSGVMTMYPYLSEKDGRLDVTGVAVQRTARRIMQGTIFVAD